MFYLFSFSHSAIARAMEDYQRRKEEEIGEEEEEEEDIYAVPPGEEVKATA
jgi:hypothetical protein